MNSSGSKPVKIHGSNILTLLIAFGGIAVSYGTINAQVVDLERRVTTLEERTLVQLTELNKNVTSLRVEVAKVSNDVEWLKDNIEDNI